MTIFFYQKILWFIKMSYICKLNVITEKLNTKTEEFLIWK
ncbi:hypothetical protein HMPREF9072_01422 [Capnocytophaga sp. oral taxon 324 str. F0483]|nr:hypothetical protein HMPREF9072_01422 [Capnocytophaga sp. oral taxon 324 str. F0483]